MSVSIHERIRKLRQVPPGRAAVAAGNVRRDAERLGYPELVDHTERVLDRARALVDIRYRYEAQTGARGEGEAATHAKVLVAHTRMIWDTVRRYATDMPETPEGRAAARVQQAYFPRGLRRRVVVGFEALLLNMEHLVTGLSAADAELARRLRIEHHVEAIALGLAPFRASLETRERVTAGELGAAYVALQESYFEMVWAVGGLVRVPEHREEMLSSVLSQDDRMKSILSARRRGRRVATMDVGDAQAEAAADGAGDADAASDGGASDRSDAGDRGGSAEPGGAGAARTGAAGEPGSAGPARAEAAGEPGGVAGEAGGSAEAGDPGDFGDFDDFGDDPEDMDDVMGDDLDPDDVDDAVGRARGAGAAGPDPDGPDGAGAGPVPPGGAGG